MNNFEQWVYDNAEFEFEALEEDLSPVGHLASGDDELDRQNEQYCFEGGSHWFCAKVTATLGDKTGTDYLGGCSYPSYKAFTDDETGYYPEMKAQAAIELAKEIARSN